MTCDNNRKIVHDRRDVQAAIEALNFQYWYDGKALAYTFCTPEEAVRDHHLWPDKMDLMKVEPYAKEMNYLFLVKVDNEGPEYDTDWTEYLAQNCTAEAFHEFVKAYAAEHFDIVVPAEYRQHNSQEEA